MHLDALGDFILRLQIIKLFFLHFLGNQSNYKFLSFWYSCSEASEKEADKVSEQLQSVGISSGAGNETAPSGKFFPFSVLSP